MADIRFVQADTLKEKPADVSKVGFGRVFTDYMFEMDYNPRRAGMMPESFLIRMFH